MGRTPPSDKRMPDGPASPLGTKRNSMPDGESPNCGREMPLKPQNYMKDSAGSK